MTLGVIVSHCVKNKKNSISCCGIYLGSGFILTQGIILKDLLFNQQNYLLSQLETFGYLIGKKDNIFIDIFQNSNFTVYLEKNTYSSSNILKIDSISSSENKEKKCEKNSYTSCMAEIHLLVLDKSFRKEVKKAMPLNDGWNFSPEEVDDNLNDEIEYQTYLNILSTFVILKISSYTENIVSLKKCLISLEKVTVQPTKGN